MSESEPSALGTGLGPALADYIPFMPSGARRAGAASLMAERIGQDPGALLKNPMVSQLLASTLGGASAGAAKHLGASKSVMIGAGILPLLAVQVLKRHRIKSIQRDYDTEERKRLREVGSLDEVLDGNVGSRRLGLARAYEAMRTRKLHAMGPLTEAADALPVAAMMYGGSPQATLPVTQLIDHLAANKIQKEAAMLRRALGRVVTNVVEPYGYGVGAKWKKVKEQGLLKNLKAIVKDEPAYELGTNYTTRDLPYRRMFGLPAHRGGIGNYTKNGPGSFRFSGRKPGSAESLENVANQAHGEARTAGPIPKDGVRFAGDDPPTMTGYDGRVLPGDVATYRDRWDLDLNPGEHPTDSLSNMLRHTFAKVTKPVTIEGSVNYRTLQNNPLGKSAAFTDQDSIPVLPLFLASALGSSLSAQVLGNVATSRWSKNTIPRDQWGGLVNEISGKRPVISSLPELNNGYFRDVSERHGDVDQLVGTALSDPQNQKDFLPRPTLKQLMLGHNPGAAAAKNIRDQMLNNGTIMVDPELASPALLAHEAGHARIHHDKGSLSNWLQNNAYSHSDITAPLTGMGGMAAGLATGSPLKGLLAGAGIGVLGNAGTLIPELMASYYGDRGLRQHRGGALSNDRGAQLAALGTYAAMLAGPAAMSGLLGGWVGGRRKKKITEDEDAVKQANWSRALAALQTLQKARAVAKFNPDGADKIVRMSNYFGGASYKQAWPTMLQGSKLLQEASPGRPLTFQQALKLALQKVNEAPPPLPAAPQASAAPAKWIQGKLDL